MVDIAHRNAMQSYETLLQALAHLVHLLGPIFGLVDIKSHVFSYTETRDMWRNKLPALLMMHLISPNL